MWMHPSAYRYAWNEMNVCTCQWVCMCACVCMHVYVCIHMCVRDVLFHVFRIQDATFYEILNFLDAADQHGKSILTVISQVAFVHRFCSWYMCMLVTNASLHLHMPCAMGSMGCKAVWIPIVHVCAQQTDSEVDTTIHNVSHEARLLKKMYLKLKD